MRPAVSSVRIAEPVDRRPGRPKDVRRQGRRAVLARRADHGPAPEAIGNRRGSLAYRSVQQSWWASRRESARWPDLAPPLLAPCPERWTLTIEPSIIVYSKSALQARILSIRSTSALIQRRNHLNNRIPRAQRLSYVSPCRRFWRKVENCGTAVTNSADTVGGNFRFRASSIRSAFSRPGHASAQTARPAGLSAKASCEHRRWFHTLAQGVAGLHLDARAVCMNWGSCRPPGWRGL